MPASTQALSIVSAAIRRNGITNVASVPQRSPLRYPGGKTWLIPEIRQWLGSLPERPRLFVEPFAGGAIAALTAIFESLADQAIICDIDDNLSALWEVILNEGSWLAYRVETFPFEPDRIQSMLLSSVEDRRNRAFVTLLLNRIRRGGILAPGASIMKNGEQGKGMASRWYPQTLARRIRDIHGVRDRIRYLHGDGLALIASTALEHGAVFFIDPPYTAGGRNAGSRLYAHNRLDHAKLFEMMASIDHPFLMTYDDCEAIRRMAAEHDFAIYNVPMRNSHNQTRIELLITPSPVF
ncbi:MAG: DNA adenine methylase [Calditrichaeota bacterium]|nr:DNA adenine methylase [Calditrichota bacterium]